MPRVRTPILATLSAALVMSMALPQAAPAAGVALPDTGLFAPVATQYAARNAVLARHANEPASAGRVLLMLAVGRTDEAASAARSATNADHDMKMAAGRALLARQDFPVMGTLVAVLDAVDDQSPHARALRYAWDFARDDEGAVDAGTRARFAAGGPDANAVVDLLAAGRVAFDMLDYARAESLWTRALDATPASANRAAWGDSASARRAMALTGLAAVHQKRRDWDGSLALLRRALDEDGGPDGLMALTETLIRMGRTDEAISAAEWAVKLAPYNDAAHYLLGNGYARKNYTQLAAAYPQAFADAAGRKALGAADAKLAAGDRSGAREAYAAVVAAHAGWADARARLASLDFEDGRFDVARDGCFAALAACPEYGRAHAILAKALESQRYGVDVHRAAYEARFAAAPMPELPGIEQFVVNWKSLSARHQKRVALSIAPWKSYLPVLIGGGATFYIKPMYQLLSECPAQEALRDQRISYDSRLWDDVRGCGGYHTVTGIEDVERTIFDKYNTVLHELTHQVHAILPADDSRTIQEHYARAKARDDKSHDGYLSRYAGGSVFEYFAEGANSLHSPMRDAYDSREVVRERLDRIDPELRKLVEGFMARTDVSASWPIAYAAGGDDRVERGLVDEAIPLYTRALERDATNETALLSLSRAQLLANRAAAAKEAAERAVAAHSASGPAHIAVCDATWHLSAKPTAALAALEASRANVRAEDRYLVNLEIGRLAWADGDASTSLAAYDSVLAYQSDNPDGMQGRANALALAGRTDDAVKQYEAAVRMRTGIPELRCDFARDLLHAGRVDEARVQLDAAKLLDEENPTAEALRAWADLAQGKLDAARAHAKQAIVWGEWCDLAHIVAGAVEQRAGNTTAAKAAWRPVDDRLASGKGPEYVYRSKLATWEEIHVMPAVERSILDSFRKR